MRSCAPRIHDALQNLETELNGADALYLILLEKAHYFHNLCEDAGKMLKQAKAEYQNLKEALESDC